MKQLSFDSDFDELFRDLEVFNSRSVRRFQSELEKIMKGIESGKIKGKWQIRRINEPGVKGYSIEGGFGSDNEFEPLEPIKPLRRRPLPERPFDVSEDVLKQSREPLIDVFEEDDALKLYAELPGEEEDDVKLKITEHSAEIKGKRFHKVLDLPSGQIDAAATTSRYKNGVLEVTIPKKKRLRDKDLRKTKMV